MSLKFIYNNEIPKPTLLKQEYLRNQVVLLKNIFQPVQKSKEWYEMRENLLTASDWGSVLGLNKHRDSTQILLSKCGLNNFKSNDAMNWGNKYEDVAVLIYEHRNKTKVLEFGCLKHPSISFLGASPDGITEDGIMLEIKCPVTREITGIPPIYYWCQVQGQLEVCELDRYDFLECGLKEYDNYEEYINDNYNGDNSLNKLGYEKGVIIEFYNRDTKTFVFYYSPVCIIGQDLEKWKNDMILKYQNENIVFSYFYYWYLEKISCIPIYRNQEWFNIAKIELEDFWNSVLKYRKLGLDKLQEDINENKIKSQEEKIREKERLKEEKKVENDKKKKEEDKKKRESKKNDVKNKKKDCIILDYYTNKNNKTITDSSDDMDIDNYNDDLILNSSVSMFSD